MKRAVLLNPLVDKARHWLEGLLRGTGDMRKRQRTERERQRTREKEQERQILMEQTYSILFSLAANLRQKAQHGITFQFFMTLI